MIIMDDDIDLALPDGDKGKGNAREPSPRIEQKPAQKPFENDWQMESEEQNSGNNEVKTFSPPPVEPKPEP